MLSVVAFHAAPGRLPSGFIGVDVFFVISGYLITSIILKGHNAGTFSLIDFYARRARRILPALLIVMAATFAAGYVILPVDQLKELSKHVAAGAGFISNLVLWNESGYFDSGSDFKPLLHLWSLGIEEQFYIVWPVILWLVANRRKGYISAILILAISSFALNVWAVADQPDAAFYSPMTRFFEILVGALLAHAAVFRDHATIDRSALRSVASAVGAILLAASFLAINKQRAFPGWWALLPTVGTACLIGAGPQAWLNRVVLTNRILVWCGLISFPLYLWHWPLLSLLRIVEGTEIAQWKRAIAVALAIALSWLTYILVERPIRRSTSGKKLALTLAVSTAVAGLLGCYAFLSDALARRTGGPAIVNSGDIGHTAFFEYIQANNFPCTPSEIRDDAAAWNGITRCFQSKNSTVRDIALVGDSHAEHLFPGLANRLPSRNVVFYGKGGLPLLNNDSFSEIFRTVVSDRNVTTVLLSAQWSRAMTFGAAEETFELQLQETVSRLVAAGKRVYIVEDVPAFSFLPHRCKYSGRLGISNQCSEVDHRSHDDYRAAIAAVAIAHTQRRVSVVDLDDLFCRDNECSMASEGMLYYRDDNHLNTSGSALVAAAITEQLAARGDAP